ncbi:PAS domain-containing sensor histidine kinase [Hymenobacter metallilatus]|uniref:histidine kinase n=1 Tax=Hymenobacter metallilatus TaxID=2493666 RepID=A0A428JC75_9BACT|nr:PAS domain S-box protein [Hymenobacter metallilatus]RSK29517.1 PAS domain S-box protein [Hymenobacter metallilatus]
MNNSDMLLGNVEFAQSPEPALLLDAAGTIRLVTAGLAQLVRQPAGELLGRALADLATPYKALTAPMAVAQAATGTPTEYEAWLEVPGEALLVSFSLLALPRAVAQPCLLYAVARVLTPTTPAQELLEQERHLSIIFNTMTDVAFVLAAEEEGRRFRFVFVNQAFEKTTGLPATQVIGRLVTDVIPEPALTQVQQYYQRALRSRQPVMWQEVSEYPNGRKIGEVHITPLFIEGPVRSCQLVGIVHDLTRQKETEARLQLSNERFQYAIKATTDAIYDWNIAADTLYWGEGFEQLFGHRLETNPTPFSKWADYVEPAEHHRVVEGLRHTAFRTANEFWQQEYHFRRADGSWAVVFDRGYFLRDAQGQPIRMIGAMQDISDRKEAEEQQRRLTDRLIKQNADLQQFTYIISHNLRAPLANALGYADLLSRIDRNSAVFEESLRHLSTSIQLLDAVLTDVNSILSIRDQQDSGRTEPVTVSQVCRQALVGLQQQLEECGGELRCEIPEGLRILGNRAYFHSIFHNLVSNAIKYRSDARSLLIEIQTTSTSDQHTEITIRDNGSGFDQHQGDVFQLYRRFHSDKPGRGIGLFLVKAHVESMHGQIAVQSVVGVGTQFTLRF